MDDDTLAATTSFCALCQHEEGAHAPSGSPEGRPCAEDGCRCPGFHPVQETCEGCGHASSQHVDGGPSGGCRCPSEKPGAPPGATCPCRWVPGSMRQPEGEYLLCPSCGASDWRADYDVASHQGVWLQPDGKGGFDVVDYKGDTDTYDDAESANWYYRCCSCDLHLPSGDLERGEVLERARRALRLLQMFDNVATGERYGLTRPFVLAAQSELGEALSLECNGTPEPGGIDHQQGTCPVHEWLDEQDGVRAEAWENTDLSAPPVSLLGSGLSGAPPTALPEG